MRTHFILLLILMGSVELLHAQRTQQPDRPVIAGTVPLTSRVNYSTSGKDSLKVELINVDFPGLEIISCENCIVNAPWLQPKGGTLDVVVMNKGAARSSTATVWVEYGTYLMKGSGGFQKVVSTSRKGVPELDPGQTTKLTFSIKSTLGDKIYISEKKLVRVSLTQNGGRAWRGN